MENHSCWAESEAHGIIIHFTPQLPSEGRTCIGKFVAYFRKAAVHYYCDLYELLSKPGHFKNEGGSKNNKQALTDLQQM